MWWTWRQGVGPGPDDAVPFSMFVIISRCLGLLDTVDPFCTLDPYSPFLHTTLSEQKVANKFFIMSSNRQASSRATPSTSNIQSNIQLFIDALADYANLTGIDLSNNPFATTLEHSNFPEAILRILQEREKAFKEYRDDNRRLISCLSPAVNVLQAFSGILGEAVSLVSHACHLVTFF